MSRSSMLIHPQQTVDTADQRILFLSCRYAITWSLSFHLILVITKIMVSVMVVYIPLTESTAILICSMAWHGQTP